MFQTKVVNKIKTHISYSVFFLSRPVCEMMWRNIAEPGKPQMTMAHAHCMLATNVFSGFVIITALTQQQWLHERASMLRYTYIVCLVVARVLMHRHH